MTVVCGIDCLACQNEFFVKNSFDVKENYEHTLAFSVSVSLNFPCTAHVFFPKRHFNHLQGFRRTFSEICIKFHAVPSLNPSRSRNRPDTRLQIKGLTARVFRRDSPPTRSRTNTGSGGERSSMLSRVERCLLALKANESLITTPLNFHEWIWPTTAQPLLDCHF
jgi:hypothetical protein